MTRIFFATNRNPAGAAYGDRPHGSGADTLEYGAADVAVNQSNVHGSQVSNIDMFGHDPQCLQNALNPGRATGKALIAYIHGSSTSFENALREAAAIKEHYGSGGAERDVLVCSWPSNAAAGMESVGGNYSQDRTDAEASGKALANSLRLALSIAKHDANGSNVARVHIFAQSMGVYALGLVFKHHQQELGGSGSADFGQVFLTGGDEDHDAFGSAGSLADLPRWSERVNVYSNRYDALLLASERFHGKGRLGLTGPSTTGGQQDVDSIDASFFSLNPLELHGYFLLRRSVRQDIAARL